MIDLKLLREDPERVKKSVRDRNAEDQISLDGLSRADKEWRDALKQAEELRSARNKISREINELKKAGKPADAKLKEAKKIDESIPALEEKTRLAEEKLRELALLIPNPPHESVPLGKSEEDNVVVSKWGAPKKFSFTPKPHWELGKNAGIMEFERAAKLAGANFTLLKDAGAKLSRALINFMLDLHEKQGYREIAPPLLANKATMFGSGQLPKFEDDLFACERDGLYLIPTSEVPLVNMHAGEHLTYKQLPLAYTAYTPCFRREAGAHGKITGGMIRQHIFDKVELVKIVEPQDSFADLDKMVEDSCEVLRALEIPFQVTELCTGDLGFASAKTFDVNAWLPSQQRFLEIASCSNCTDFQARRMNLRYWTKKNESVFPHTLNASGLAVGRTIVALLENYQREDGSVGIPKALQSYVKMKEIR